MCRSQHQNYQNISKQQLYSCLLFVASTRHVVFLRQDYKQSFTAKSGLSQPKTASHDSFTVVSRQFHDSFTVTFRTVHTRAQQGIFNRDLFSQFVQKDSFCSRQITRLNSLTIRCKLFRAFMLNTLLYNRSLGTYFAMQTWAVTRYPSRYWSSLNVIAKATVLRPKSNFIGRRDIHAILRKRLVLGQTRSFRMDHSKTTVEDFQGSLWPRSAGLGLLAHGPAHGPTEARQRPAQNSAFRETREAQPVLRAPAEGPGASDARNMGTEF